MQMTENEIVRNYRAAKNKTEQINILKDLNCCSKEEIIDILKRNGEKMGRYEPKSKEWIEKVRQAKTNKKTEELEIEAPEVEVEIKIEEPEPSLTAPAEQASKEPLPEFVLNAVHESILKKLGEIEFYKDEIERMSARLEQLEQEVFAMTDFMTKEGVNEEESMCVEAV